MQFRWIRGGDALQTWPADIPTINAHSRREKKKIRHSVFRTVETCSRSGSERSCLPVERRM